MADKSEIWLGTLSLMEETTAIVDRFFSPSEEG